MGIRQRALEKVGMTPTPVLSSSFWSGRRVLVTGHTGFKGSWLCLWLQYLGAELQGFALGPPTRPSLFEEARVAAGMRSTIGDVRDLPALRECVRSFRPELIMHLAAQSLVRESYDEPVGTYSTNVIGTVNLFEAARATESVRAIVNVTTDKCYENREWAWGYREDEPMGGHDPYSSSKGCSELVTSAYRRSYFSQAGVAVASARAGNVIGGGDWARDRLIPDVLRSFAAGEAVQIRYPVSTRPWQHVLEPLAGYLVLAQALIEGGTEYAQAWNFGPRDDDAKSVQWIVEHLASLWGQGATWQVDGKSHPHEAGYLKLDISKAKSKLRWAPRWCLNTSLEHIVEWHKGWLARRDVNALCLSEISDYLNDLKADDPHC